ncbi:DUF3780 domain-containing protein [Allofranklinella schreckenbergeri]|uniref:DUF3780 domain-containing protein n=1 Tax=Allofranklinella schreckenbergeri TaxID=1076744 RepID=A0A3M6R2B3_9BURK|nr:DUF3780 domain-containing protein [Allofranklinella schreckenbergeri]RMX09424.1 DUF3780 domain-containing protein [Allofranklinella schreckenbergeri]
MAGVKTATLTFRNAVIDRDLLGRPRWTAFRAEIQRAFDARLVARGIEPGAWEVGDNSADRLSGKELCVLAWLVEQIEGVPVAVRNWLAPSPEKRWRAALKHALGDVAQSELLAPRARCGKPAQEVALVSLGLLGGEAP